MNLKNILRCHMLQVFRVFTWVFSACLLLFGTRLTAQYLTVVCVAILLPPSSCHTRSTPSTIPPSTSIYTPGNDPSTHLQQSIKTPPMKTEDDLRLLYNMVKLSPTKASTAEVAESMGLKQSATYVALVCQTYNKLANAIDSNWRIQALLKRLDKKFGSADGKEPPAVTTKANTGNKRKRSSKEDDESTSKFKGKSLMRIRPSRWRLSWTEVILPTVMGLLNRTPHRKGRW